MKITIDQRYCKGCNICIKVCPRSVFAASSRRSDRGYLMPEVGEADKCLDCGMCEIFCPDICIDVKKEVIV